MKIHIHCCKIFFVLVTVAAVAQPLQGEPTSTDNHDVDSSSSGTGNQEETIIDRIVQSLFRFPASRLGPEFDELLQNWQVDWLHATNTSSSSATATTSLHQITPEPAGKAHALYSVSTPAATLFRRQCYGPAPQTDQLHNLYKNFEQRRKTISFEYMKDAMEEMRLMHTMTKRFYPAFQLEDNGGGGASSSKDQKRNSGHGGGAKKLHEKKSKSTVNTIHARTTLPSNYDLPSKLAFQTTTVSNSNNSNDDDDDDVIDTDNKNQTTQQQWSWYPPGHFSSRGTPDNAPFRMNMYKSMRNQLQTRLLQQQQQVLPDFNGFEHGRPSGMYWYPPGGVREWHNNYLDLVGNVVVKGDGDDGNGGRRSKNEEIFSSQVWRMYFVRTVRDAEFDEKLLASLKKKSRSGVVVDDQEGSNNGHSAMHIIPGEDSGVTLEVLQKAGARPLTEEEEMRQWSDEFAEDYSIPPTAANDHNAQNGNTDADGGGESTTVLDRNSVWRIPDQDGYVTFFRLPDIWHCIVSEEVHRYSLGFAFSDREVQALLKLAGVEYDVVVDGKGNDDGMDKKDEL
ncbi:hypothetical protein ACHAXR_011725 [Thalassiosira sp. AJA248-18]